MTRSVPLLAEYKRGKTSVWCIDFRQDGTRRRKFYKSKIRAAQELRRMKTKLRREGEAGLNISDEVRAVAIKCTGLLSKYPGKTLLDATRFYVKHLEDSEKSITVSELIAEYLDSQKRAKRSTLHQSDLKQRLERFGETFGQLPVRTITPGDLEQWLDKLRLSPTSINNYRGRISSLLAFGVKRGYLDRNPMSSVDEVKVADVPPEIFTPDELAQLLKHASVEFVPCLVIGGFAGLRTAELVRLEWKDVDLKRGHLNVPATKSKSARRRLIRMSANLIAWLLPYDGRAGRIWSNGIRAYHLAKESAWTAAGLSKWAKNGLRHSFASYHLAKHGDAPQLALDMGHVSPKMIFDHYREIVTPEEAERYWNIVPARAAENVVPMAQGLNAAERIDQAAPTDPASSALSSPRAD